MLRRLGIASRFDLIVFTSLALLVAIAPLGREATHPVVLGLYRTLLLTIASAAILQTTQTSPRFCPYLLAAAATIGAAMITSVLLQTGSHFEGTFVFYRDALFFAAFVSLARLSPQRPPAWKTAVLTFVVLVDLAYLAAAITAGNRPLIGPFVNPNCFASFLLVGLAVCAVSVFFAHSVWVRMGAAIAGLLLFYGIGQTSSRGATLAALGVLALTLVRWARSRGVGWVGVVAAIVTLCLVTAAVNPALIHKFLDRGQHDPYNYQRVQIWIGTLKMIASHPVFGVGLGHYWYVSKPYTPAVDGAIFRHGKWPNIAHSEYLQYIAEIGVPAALLLFAMAGYLLRLAWRRAETTPPESRIFQEAALCAAAGLGAHALVDNNWTVPVLAAGLAVISQADLLPQWTEAAVPWEWTSPSPAWTPVRLAAFGLCVFGVFTHSAFIPALGLYFNDAGHRASVAEDFKRAELMHRFAIAILPDHPVLLDNLGLAYLDDFKETHKSEYLDRAETFFERSMAANPDSDVPGAHLETVLLQRLTGDPKKDQPIHARIIEADRYVLRTNPFNPFIRKNLAEALYISGDRQAACEQLLKAINLEPNYVPAYLRLAELYREDGRSKDGDAYRRKAIEVIVQYEAERRLDPFDALLLGRPPNNLRQP